MICKYLCNFYCHSSELSRMIEEQTGIVRQGQLMIVKEAQWTDSEKLPSTDVDTPILLFNRDNNNVVHARDKSSRESYLAAPFFPSLSRGR